MLSCFLFFRFVALGEQNIIVTAAKAKFVGRFKVYNKLPRYFPRFLQRVVGLLYSDVEIYNENGVLHFYNHCIFIFMHSEFCWWRESMEIWTRKIYYTLVWIKCSHNEIFYTS